MWFHNLWGPRCARMKRDPLDCHLTTATLQRGLQDKTLFFLACDDLQIGITPLVPYSPYEYASVFKRSAWYI